MIRRLAAAVVSASIALLAARTSEAAPPRVPDWAFGSPTGEAILGGVAVASLGTFFLPQARRAWGPDAPRDFDARYNRLSDFTGAVFGSLFVGSGVYLAEGAYLADTETHAPFRLALRTTLVDTEAVLFAAGLTNVTKRISGRCRPRSWKDGECGGETTDHDSFPSGHTSPIAAIAGVGLVLALRTPGDAGPRWGAFVFAETTTLVTATLRVLAGAHSRSDVAASWVLGHATGVLVALAHPMMTPAHGENPSAPATTPLAWSGSF